MARETVVVGAAAAQAEAFRISWGAVFAGMFVALGVWILLHALGLAAGLTAIDPDNPRTLRGVGIGTGIWSLIAPLIALFVGGYVASRSGGVLDRGLGALEGAVLWGLTLVAGALLLGMALASVVGVGVQVGSADVGAAPVPPRDALAAAETTGKALWGVFLVLLLGLASAVAGGITGVHRRARVVAVAVPPVPPERRVPLETT